MVLTNAIIHTQTESSYIKFITVIKCNSLMCVCYLLTKQAFISLQHIYDAPHPLTGLWIT